MTRKRSILSLKRKHEIQHNELVRFLDQFIEKAKNSSLNSHVDFKALLASAIKLNYVAVFTFSKMSTMLIDVRR